MIKPSDLYTELSSKGISFFTGVPDSLLKDFCAFITDSAGEKDHIIAANEGAAVALASGHFLATDNPALVYLQNSGQGNAINPLLSLADPAVYSIPVLLLIGWRGAPGRKDEPQHVKQGKVTIPLLDALGIPFGVLPDEKEAMESAVTKAVVSMKERSAPYALVVRKGTFEPYVLQKKVLTSFDLSREDAVKIVTATLGEEDIVVSTTGKTSRELFEFRETLGHNHEKDFLTVGSMGHASMIALAIAEEKQERNVFCFDGDGAMLMHLGALAIIGSRKPQNFKHVLFNNGAHDSVGGQPTVGFSTDFCALAKACGYVHAWSVSSEVDVKEKLAVLAQCNGPTLLEIKVNKGARKDLGRPTTTPRENKGAFMKFLAE